MMRAFFDHFTVLGTHKTGLRAVFRYLHPDVLSERNARERATNLRCLKYMLASDADAALYFDLRQLNGTDGDRFHAFWDTLGEHLRLDVGESAHERRHGDDAMVFASKIISIPVLIREVSKLLWAKQGHENDLIPSKQIVRIQFSPNHPGHLTAGFFSARFKIKRRVQTRCLRMEHENAHWVAALAKYNKIALVRLRDALVAANYPRGVLRLGCDDQKQMPVGPPGLPIDSGARPHHPVAVPVGQPLDASDHGLHLPFPADGWWLRPSEHTA